MPPGRLPLRGAVPAGLGGHGDTGAGPAAYGLVRFVVVSTE